MTHRSLSTRTHTFHTTYNGDGQRVKKIVPATGEVTVFVYDAAGKEIAEYSTIVAPQTEAKANYLTSDHLGSPRVNTDQSGAVISRHDYHPFGEEISTTQRTGHPEYAGDGVRKQFTGYEKDNESDLDYAINRYHSPSLGRFNSVDPYNIILEKEKGKNEEEKQRIFIVYISQPQIWNKFVYSVNNPLNLSDPDGRRPVTTQEQENLKKFRESGYEYSYEQMRQGNWNAQQAEAFRHSVDRASQVIENAILAVGPGQTDPTNLRVVLYAINKVGDQGYGANVAGGTPNGTEKHIDSNGVYVSMGADQNKCNLFVAAAYVLGGGIGFKTNQNPGGYQANGSLKWGWAGYSNVPLSNDIAKGIANFTSTSNPTFGDIIVHPETTGGGHSAIYVNETVVVSANWWSGVRTGSMEKTNTTVYMTYKP